MPVMDSKGAVYGYVARKLDNQVGSKTLSMLDNNRGAWYSCYNSRLLMIVEDQLSAIRNSQYMNTVALLGTSMSPGIMTEIKSGGYTDIYLALDPDAFPKSIKMAREIRPSFSVQVVRLPKDIKNMTEDEHLEWLDKNEIEWYK